MIEYVQIFGERCSGTNYLASLIQKNFDGVEITKDFGGKHWFIKDHRPRGRPNPSTDHQCVRTLKNSDDTLFVVIYRNPLDWLHSLHCNPYHAADHRGLEFSEFIRKPWVSFETRRMNPRWPKSDDDTYFIEEAENILRLRTLKIQHLNRLQEAVKNIAFINYEELVLDTKLLVEVAEPFGVRLKQHPPVDDSFYHGGGPTRTFTAPKRYAPLAAGDLDFVRENLDWEVEAGIGYEWIDGA